MGEFQPHTGRLGSRAPVGDPIPDYYPRIVTPDAFYAAQAAMHGRQQQRGRTGRHVTNLFTGLVTDARDGSPMSVVMKDNRRLVSGAGIRGQAPFISFPYDAFEFGVLRWLLEIDVADVMGQRPKLDADLRGAEGRLHDLGGRIKVIQDRLATDTDLTPLLDVLGKLHAEHRGAQEQVERLRAERAATQDVSVADALALVNRLLQLEDDPARGDDLFDLRSRLKARIRSLVEGLDVCIEVDGPVRRALVRIRFRSGAVRVIEIIVRRGNDAIGHKMLAEA
jgi:hypothetical protein